MEANQASIQEMYSRMEGDGWNTSGPLKWGFFFFSEQRERLENVYGELADHNYLMESIHQCDGEWVLSVSKVEVLPADKLFRRCLAFNELADRYGSFFDGWDVGKAG